MSERADSPCAATPSALFIRHQRDVSADTFQQQTSALATELLGARHCINLCRDRYFFALGFCATVQASAINLLPTNRQPETTRDLLERYGETLILSDQPLDDALQSVADAHHARCIDVSTVSDSEPLPYREPGRDTVAAIVFTSGSTGQPSAIEKPWRSLAGTAERLNRRFAPSDAERFSVVATVPAQHMYGLETTVMLALCGQATVHSGQPFFPADIATALSEMPAPRILVTTPVHLKALVRSSATPPAIFSAPSPGKPALRPWAKRRVQPDRKRL